MEGEREKSPINAEQQEENLDSVSNDGQETSGQPSSSTSALSSKAESPGKQMDGSERALSNKLGVQLCPYCNSELDPNVHRFCSGCGKTIQECISIVHQKQDSGVQLCPNCNIELDTNVHKFCHGCGGNIQQMLANVHKKQDTKLFHTPVSEPDSSEQLSNSEIDFSRNIKEVNFVGETKTAVVETVGEGYQQVTAASKKTSVNENKTTGKATSQTGNGNELNESGARHTVSNSAEQTSNCVTVVAGEINEISHVLVEETVPAGTLTENVQQSPASPKKTTVDDQNSMGEGNGGSETYPEHVITLRSMSNNPDLPCHDENEKLTGIIQDNDGCAGKLKNTSDSDPCIEESKNKLSETPFLQELNEVLDTLDEFVEEFQTTRMRNKSDREGEKEENAKKEGKKEGEKEESSKTEGEKMQGEKGSDQGGEKEGEKNVSNKKEGVKESEKKENEKKEGKNTEGEKKASNNEGEKEGGKKESNKKEGVKREGEKKEDEKEGEKKEDEKKEGEKKEGEKKVDEKKVDVKKEDGKKEDERKEGEKKEGEKKQDEKKQDEKKQDEKKEGEKKEDEKEGEKKEDEKKEGEKKDDEKKEGERNEGEKKEGEKKEGKNKEGEKKEVDKKEGDKKEGEKNEDEKGKKQYSKDEKETQKTVISRKNENKKDVEPSEARRTTRSITNAAGVQDGASTKGKTLLEQATPVPNDPLLHGSGSTDDTNVEKQEGYFYQKPEVDQGQRGKNNKKTKGKNKNSASNDSQNTLTVVFHAILSNKFKLEDGTKIVIRGDEPLFAGGWNKGGVPVTTAPYRDKQLVLHGELKVPLRLASFGWGYKYVLMNKKNKPSYEVLVEFKWWASGIMNRCLVIGKDYTAENETFHKYDGFIYPEPSTWDRLTSFSSGAALDNRRAFFQEFFPKWSGFYVDSFDINIQPVKALQQLECLVDDISAVWTSDTTRSPYRRSVDYVKLRLSEVFKKILMPKLEANLKVLGSQTQDAKAKVHTVLSSVTIAYVFTKYNVYLTYENHEILLKCLKLPPNKEACLEFMKSIDNFDNNILTPFIQTILQYYRKQSSNRLFVRHWLSALPLLHFLRRETKPFDDMTCEKPINFSNSKWWGLGELPCKDIQKHITAGEAIAMLQNLESAFDMDRLLKRTFLILCPVEIYVYLLKTGSFSCLELCITMRKLLPDKTSFSYSESFVKSLAVFFKELNETLSNMSPSKCPKYRLPETLILLNSLVRLAVNLTHYLELSQVEVLCRLVECLVTAIDLQKRGIDLENDSVVSERENDSDENLSTPYQLTDISKMSSFFNEQFAAVDDFMNKKLSAVYLEYCRASEWNQELRAWTELLSLSAPEIFKKPWKDKFITKFKSRIHKVPLLRQIDLFALFDQQKCNTDIVTCLSDSAFEAVDKLAKGGQGERDAFERLSRNSSTNAIRLLREMLRKAWPTEKKEDNQLNDREKDEVLLKHLLTWSTWPGFLKFFGSSSSAKDKLTEDHDCAIMMTRAESCLDNLIKSVEKGTVTVATLKFLEEHSDQYLKLGEIHKTTQKVSISIEDSFSQRRRELEAFLTLRKHVECFIYFSDKFTSVDEKLRVLRDKIVQDYNELSICDLCTKRSGGYDIVFFNLDDKFHEMVSKITEIKNSQIFKKLWQKYGEKLKNELVTMEVMFTKIWSRILDKLKSINEQFLDGEMQLKKVDKYLVMCNTDYDGLEEEFMLLSRYFSGTAHLGGVKKKLGVSIKKVRSYKQLFDAQQAALAILELQEVMGLEGDFSQVEKIKEIIGGKFERQAIKSVSDNLLKAGELLKDINPTRRSCLMAFTKCFDLVTWLRKSIQDEQELKVFVDLAMISAGEDDMEIDRISCMHTSCLGFGSLIFGCKTDHGFDDLMRLCQPVWQAVDANTSIEEKLVLTTRGLSWLKQIKESHGSVALTTMVQVEAINSCGIYYIADSEKAKESKHVNNGVKLCLENLVSLVVPEDESKNREVKIYSLEEVKDVQSKLMLIAGKAESGKEEVDQFNQVFEGILRVSDLYLQLCEVGEISNLTWKTKFRCSKIEGCREELLDNIDKTCETMENKLKQWKKNINGERHKCYSLNHFTMKQILNLRKELAKACIGLVAMDELPLQTFMLLEAVNKAIDPLLLANVLRKMIPENSIFLTEEGFKDEQKYFANDTGGEEILLENVEEEIDVIQPIMRKRKNSLETFTAAKETLEGMSMNYSEEYLLAALEHCGRRATEDELVAWVASDDYDEETVTMLCEKAKKNPRLSDLVKDVFGPEFQAINDEETFLCNMTANETEIERPQIVLKPYVNNEEDTYLTLEILAALLDRLSESESDYVRRQLPSVLKEGEPNLLLVPKGEVFGCVLSLFMGANDQPLPTDEEVIVCDENTTAEEIELLWRRAVVDESGLLFCLANADLLDYDVSQQAVRSLILLTQNHSRYHLVVICSIENEDKSHMVASIDQFRRQFPLLAPMRGIQHYLKEQLVVSDAKMVGDVQWAPAATVDMEKLSVRVVQSSRAGMGKSLVVKHLAEQLTNLPNNKKLREDLMLSLCPTIPVHGISVDSDCVTRTLRSHAVKRDIPVSRIFHLDMSQSVVKGLDNFLFKLVILRAVKDHSGNVWRRKSTDMYVVEITTDKSFEILTAEDAVTDGNYNQNTRKRLATNKYSFVKFLPRTHCLTPRETLDNIHQNRKGDTEFDMEKFRSEEYQRTFQYLTQFANGSNLDKFSFIYDPCVIIGDPVDALKIIIKYCGIRDPSWAELYHFVNFLNIQLRDCEESVFCDPLLVGDLLQGFRTFAVRFMIQMSRDFATRSLSDNNLGVEDASKPEEEDDLAPFQIRRRWEKSPHPYIFFNHDRDSMTFLGFLLSEKGDLLDPGTNTILEKRVIEPTLRGQLKHQGVDFDVNYEERDRMARIENLCSVMGIEYLHDPDTTYELTTDNVEKILAIHMRFRCGIPVIIMGETGCGKTRLIRFMCELQAGPDGPKNLLLMKVHGGTSYAEIEKKVKDAEKLASCNERINVDTILFFDEANTTDAIDLIKEIMVDRRVNGRAINPELTRLHFIAACNPYRKHTKEMIKKLESAGLGYHVSADETEDKLGSIPLRQLVYRVHPLPESMRPLVWDFGQLTDHTEELYTAQIVRRFMVSPSPDIASARPATGGFVGTLRNAAQASCIARVLSASQKYMRNQKNECSFVSLRDVERAMKVIVWFYSNSELIDQVIGDEYNFRDEDNDSSEESSEEESCERDDAEQVAQPLSQIVRAVVLGIGVCYYARLNEREVYCRDVCRYFDHSCPLPGGVHTMKNVIRTCQRGFLKDIQLGQNIARNTALSENVFMMAICTELRIPLFVVGKPGSSKSLAKDVISTNMKAGNSQSELFKNLKQIHMQSYQCSPLSTPEGIVSTFRQCAKLQKDKDLNKFVSVVVLDEIGLAEDSPLMPLKTLHPLLEDGTATTEESGTTSDHRRVGFIGLSNWALDPAKMNRGIMLSRGVPSENELCDSARGICSSNKDIQNRLEAYIGRLCNGYFDLYEQQSDSETLKNAQKDEFFGLRDFYSLVKMVYGFAVQTEQGEQLLSDVELEQSIRRNFSGLDDLDPVKIFSGQFLRLKHYVKHPSPECLPVKLIQESLGRTEVEGESRYLLVLTENYAALRLLQGQLQNHDPVIIFGSSFPKDQQYTQICRNINRIKVCMETGRMVILLNLESLYESLYDALNQYYVYLDKQKYVDLGLGNHRVKCRVADKFKLIVVAEKDDVYERFPIPLINRLEKHLLVMSTGLTERQAHLAKELEDWVKLFSDAKPEYLSGESIFKPGDCFVGYHSDTAAAVVMKFSKLENGSSNEQILSQSRYSLLQCASPDAIARLPATKLKHYAEELWTEYFRNQKHGSLKDYLVHCLGSDEDTENDSFLVQITTHSRLLSQANSRAIASAAGFTGSQSRCISLQEFHTEQQFVKTLEEFFVALGGAKGLLLVQCDNGEANFNLIACCRYLVDDTRRRTLEDFDVFKKPIHIIFIIQLPKIAGGCQHFVGFQGGKWQSIHIDELLESNEQLPQIEQLVNRSVSDLFQPAYSARGDDIEDRDVDLDASIPSGSQKLHVENIEDSDEEKIDQQNIKPTLLLKNCLQDAAARIYDESAEVTRATKRIEILLKWLPEDNSQETEFSKIIATRVHNLLRQRDEKCPEDQRLWLQHEALRQGHLQETGTFRKALWQKLSSIVSPMLSEVIAYCDQNHNLDLLREGNEWQIGLWLTMFSKDVITPLSYDSFTSPVSGRVRERARVLSTGVGHCFSAKFPFSWIIKDIVNVLLPQVGADPPNRLISLRGVFYSSPLGQLLKPVFEDENIKEEAAKNYLEDFVHMMYKPIVKGELQLICDAVVAAAVKLHQSLYGNDDVELDIPLIHFTYSLIQARLVNFSELVHAFPNLVQTIWTKCDQLNVEEMSLDLMALECCLKQLEPKPRDLENADNRLIWCNRVQCIRPIIQVMITLIPRPSQQQTGLQNCRTTWIRLDVVRMFIEHTCPPGQSTHPADAENAFLLSKALGENTDFSTVHTMTVIEKFLKRCSDEMRERLIRFDISQCEICQNPLQDPVEMPCEHICCMSCANDWFHEHNICPICREEVGGDFKVEISEKCRRALEIYNSFRNRCKSFFMELVSVYCFGEQLPNPDLVRKFIGYVIKDENETEDFTPFDGQGIDVTPVIRSYILQQLLTIKEREKEVYKHLEEYLHRARGLAEQREHFIEVCVLCVQCMEDVQTVKLLKAKEGGENVQILLASRELERTLRTIHIHQNSLTINCLRDIAGIRAALDVLSTYLGDDFAENVKRFEALPKCLEAAKHLCSNSSRSVLQLFLLKQLVRHDPNGIDAVKERCKRKELKWIMPPQSEEQDKTPDNFIVHHENYHTVREAVGKAILTSNIDDLNLVIQEIQVQPSARSCYVLLALFREITTSFSHVNKEDEIPARVLEKLKQYIAGIQYLPNELKRLAGDFLTNFENTNSQLLQLSPRQSGNDRRLIELLIHFLIVMKCLRQNRLLQPLMNLAFNSALMRNAFIPTMPHDDGPELMQANIGRWYECPSGHRYVITECGNPNQSYRCPICNADIGGQGILAANNRDASMQDRSSTGHILGHTQAQQQNVTSVRNLTPLSCGVLRCLTHVAMLLGTDQNIQNIAAIIKPPVHDVVQFLKEHLQHDIRCIARSTGNNDDEAVQIIHLVLAGIVNNLGQQGGYLNIDGNLTTKDSRTAWEDGFMTTYLTPVLSAISGLLQDSLGRMVRDERLGNNRLMRLLHELDGPNYESISKLDSMCPALWRYRKKITIENVSFKFQEYSQGRDKPERCEVLAEFLKKEHHLRALQYFPDIIKLQRLLFEKFHRRLDRNEAEEFTLGKFLKTSLQVKEQFSALVNSFKMAWKIVRPSLLKDGPYSIPQEMCDIEVINSTPISMFLPAKSGQGRCALALNNFLVTLHNDFIGRCKSLLKDESRPPEIPLANITKAHLVAYDPEKDFLPMILAHCDYSLKVGEGTTVEFNWKCLERQLVDRFIRGRPRLISLIELFVFSKDICDGEVFKALKQKIPQEELTRPVQDQILNELNQLTDVCDALKSLHIAIGFLSSAGGDPSMSIHEYLHSGLKMTLRKGLKSGKAELFCQLQHIVSLWLLLSLERARVLTKRKQDPFDDVSEKVKSSLDKKQKFCLNNGLQKLNVDHFVGVLLEFILLYLKHVPDDQLHFPLSQYINAKLEEKERDVIDGLEEYIPEDIKVEHAVEAWKVACQKSEDYHSRMQE